MKTQNQATSQEVSLPMQPMSNNLPEEQPRPGSGNRGDTTIGWNILRQKSLLSVKIIRITLSNNPKAKGSLRIPQRSMSRPHKRTLLIPVYRTPERSPTIPKPPPTLSFHPSRLLTEYSIKTLSRDWTLIKDKDTDVKKRRESCTSRSSPSTCFLTWICRTWMNFLTDTSPWASESLSPIITRTHTGQRRQRSQPKHRRQRRNTRT